MTDQELFNLLKQVAPKRVFKKEEPGNITVYTGGLGEYTVTVSLRKFVDETTMPPLEDYEVVLFKVYDNTNTDITPISFKEQYKLDIGFKLMNSKLFGA